MQQTFVDSRYEVLGALGGGGMAKVYLARDRVLDRAVALKVLREQYAGDEQFVERFRQEARNAASLSHPNIVQVYDRGRFRGGEYYIAMEHIPGGTLKDRLVREGPLDADGAAGVAEQIAGALSAAHEKGVVHRDIKPHNVLITASGDVKVGDFGIARAASSPAVTAASVILGTAAYMSPEQAKGEPATPRSDLYSLGVVLYEMLTGQVPYEAQTPVAVAVKHISQPPRLPRETHPNVPESLNDVAARLLAKKPEDRYASAAEVVADLRRARRGEAPIARGAAGREARAAREDPTMVLKRSNGAGEQAAGARRRRKKMPLLALAASVVFVASLSAFAWAASEERLGGREAKQASAALLEEAHRALGGKVEVPNVVGSERAEAQGRLVGAGFEVDVRPVEGLKKDAGKVIGQSPPGGEGAEEGAPVYLDVGDGPAAVAAPDLSGLTLEEARGVLAEAGLSPGDVDEAPSDAVPRGAVIRQDPPAGERLDPDAAVDLVLSSGPEPRPAPRPVPETTPPPAVASPAPVSVPPQYGPETYTAAPPPPMPTSQQYEPAAPADEPAPAAEPAPVIGPSLGQPVVPEPLDPASATDGNDKKKQKGKDQPAGLPPRPPS